MATNNTKQTAWLALGSLLSFGFSIVSSMILSRYLSKGDYGTYRQVMYVYNTLLTVFLLGLPRTFSYFLPRVPIDQAKHLINKLNGLFLATGAVFSLFLFLAARPIALSLDNPDLEEALRLFSPVPLLMLPTQGLDGILATYRKNAFMAIYTLLTRVLMLLCVALPVMMCGYGYKEAIVGFDIASLLMFFLALALKYYPVRTAGHEKCNITYKEIFQFAIPLLLGSLWALVINSADSFFVSRWYGKVTFAEFSNGAMELPFVGMIVAATTTVLSPIFSRMSHENVDLRKEMYPLWKNVFYKSGMLIYPMLIYCIFFADTLMVALYGQAYEVSAIYFRIKNISFFFSIIAFAPLLINTGQVKLYSNLHMWNALAVVVLEYASVLLIPSAVGVCVVSTICRIGLVLAALMAVAKYFDVRLKELFPKELLSILAVSAVILILIRVLLPFVSANVWIVLFASAGLYTVLYLIAAKWLKIDYLSIVRPLLQK